MSSPEPAETRPAESMKIWVDADACPGVIKDILFRAAERVGIELTLVANRPLRTPAGSRFVKSIQVEAGFDVADNRIAGSVGRGDLVVTTDIPLAADVVGKGAVALSPRGELYTTDNIRDRLATRDLLEQLRETGVVSGGPAALGNSDRQAFASQLDRWLARRPKPRP